jgi:hypothetical protein
MHLLRAYACLLLRVYVCLLPQCMLMRMHAGTTSTCAFPVLANENT